MSDASKCEGYEQDISDCICFELVCQRVTKFASQESDLGTAISALETEARSAITLPTFWNGIGCR